VSELARKLAYGREADFIDLGLERSGDTLPAEVLRYVLLHRDQLRAASEVPLSPGEPDTLSSAGVVAGGAPPPAATPPLGGGVEFSPAPRVQEEDEGCGGCLVPECPTCGESPCACVVGSAHE
jgi:hypothetical protein